MTDAGSPADQAPAQAQGRKRAVPAWARRGPIRIVVGALVVGGAFVVAQRWTAKPSVDQKQVDALVDRRVNAAVKQLQSAPPPGVAVFNAIRGPVVVVEASGVGAGKSSNLGSGVVVSAKGDILTALHVVQGATVIKVDFADGTSATASLRGADGDRDTAVLTADHLPQLLVPAVLGNSNGIRVGDPAYAVGHPLGLVDSLSAGVISGFGRTFRLPTGKNLTGLIQFDAAVNPGNSGGPLLNGKGQVIGIVTGLTNATGVDNFAGIGFAVPIADAAGTAGAPAR